MSEQQLAIIKDISLPIDSQTRYDVYFTDKRIAIICIGKKSDVFYGTGGLVGGLIAEGVNALDRKRKNGQLKKKEEQMNGLSLNDQLKLNKKSSFYTYDEIQEIKLITGRNPKLVILSEEFETELSPTKEQFKQLSNVLSTMGMLKDKLTK